MSNLVRWLAAAIKEHVTERPLDASPSGESRSIFHGPPLELLSPVYEQLVADGKGTLKGMPVLLQVPLLGAGEQNPAIGASGRCDDAHLLDLRNSPTAPSYLALVPPGHHAIRSVSSTTDQFGVAASSNGANVSFDDWLADPFIQRVIDAAIEATGAKRREDARELVLGSLQAIDDVDPERATRSAAWRLISRIFSVSGQQGDIASQISLACGVPRMAGSTLSAKEQVAILDGIADALSSGITAGLEEAREKASPQQQEWLEAFAAHMLATCEVPTALERAPHAFYAPSLRTLLQEPPEWWTGLTVEVWSELLEDEPEFTGDVQIECRGGEPELPQSKGVPVLMAGNVDLVIRGSAEDGSAIDVLLERSPQKNRNGFPARINVDGEVEFTDAAPPDHMACRCRAAPGPSRPGSTSSRAAGA